MDVANTQVQFDFLFGLFTYLAIAVGVVVYGLFVYYLVKYRDKPGSKEPDDTPTLGRLPASRGHARSVVYTLSISTILLAVLIIGSFAAVDSILTPPRQVCDGCGVLVTGHQFSWQFTYPDGYQSSGANSILRVPMGRDIRLNVTSADVFHDFGIIGLDIKTDAMPGRDNVLWFHPYQVKNYTIQCFELCGEGHWHMIAKLIVMDPRAFDQWYNGTRVP